jgi:nitroreductase
MSDVLELLQSRKSIRRYTAEPIPDEMIQKILEAGRWAPTGHNYQPWRLIVVRDSATKKEIGRLSGVATGSRETAYYGMGTLQPRYAGIKDDAERERVMKVMYSGQVSLFAANAAVVIVVVGSMLGGELNVPYDLAACMENMIIEAQSLEIGSCWVHAPVGGTREALKFKKLMGIPTGMGEYKVLGVLSLGWPAENRKHPRPKYPLEDLVFYEKFGNKAKPKA